MPKTVRHFREILLWPVYLQPLDEKAPIQQHWEHLIGAGNGGPWREHDDEFGDPAEFQVRHYNEFVTFLPPVQRFLYGQGLGKAVRQTYGESPIKVLRRIDVERMRVTLEKGGAPVDLSIAHIDLYFFFDIDVALLAVEVFADDLPFDIVEDVIFRAGRAYPAYWETDGRGGHCPWSVEWIGQGSAVLARSDYEKREKFLSFVCEHRAPAVAAHWEFLLAPLTLHHRDQKGLVRFRQLEYYRMPYMAFLAMEDPSAVSRAELIRMTIGSAPGEAETLPYSESYLADFEQKHCYDRYCDLRPGAPSPGTRFLASGHTLLALGKAGDSFFMNTEGGMLARFRHQHFLLFMLAHFQKAALRMFSDRLVATVSRLDITDPLANRVFRRTIREALENFLRFEHRYWFHEISNQAQARELFQLTRQHLELDALYDEVREELQDMGTYLEVDAMRRQNESVVRLTVVTILGMVGTVATGFLGMNLFSWGDQPPAWRILAFFSVFIPVLFLTLYTVVKSRRLSEFLDALADDTATLKDKIGVFIGIWRKQ